MEELQVQVVNGVLALVGTFLAWAAVAARKYFKDKVENEYVELVLLRLTDAIEVGVRDAAGVLVPQLKAAAADGKISSGDAAHLRQEVKLAAFDQLTRIDRAKLEQLFDRDQLDRKLEKLIEAAVQKLKETK